MHGPLEAARFLDKKIRSMKILNKLNVDIMV